MKRSLLASMLIAACLALGIPLHASELSLHTAIHLKKNQGVSQGMLAAHCSLDHFAEVVEANPVLASGHYHHLRLRQRIVLPASCSRAATAQEHQASWKLLREDSSYRSRHHKHYNRRHVRRHAQNHIQKSTIGRQTTDQKQVLNTPASEASAPTAPVTQPVIKTAPRAKNSSRAHIFKVWIFWILVAYFLISVALIALLYRKGYWVAKKIHIISRPLVEEINGKKYEAHACYGYWNDTEVQWEWQYSCPLHPAHRVTEENFGEHLRNSHRADVSLVEETVDRPANVT